MCYESPTKFSCFSCGNEWSDRVTQAFKKKMILCDNLATCKNRFSPTIEPPVAQYSAYKCDRCYLKILREKANEMGRPVDFADLLPLLVEHRKERQSAARLWAINMTGSPHVYFGIEDGLTNEEKKLLDEMDMELKIEKDEMQIKTEREVYIKREPGEAEVYIKQEPGEPKVYIKQEPEEPEVYIKQEPESP
jgi:hypothetical protein